MYRLCEDFLALGPVATASLGMTRIRKPSRGGNYCKKVYLEINREKFHRLFANLILPKN